jgi:enamine deaminase RidA (YjgF/YER057c/UK114 family)
MSKRDIANFGVPWEESYCYSQAIKAGDYVFVSGQLSHDEKGNFVGAGDFEKQVTQTYENLKTVLAKFGCSLKDVVHETVYVTDPAAQGETFSKIHKELYGKCPPVSDFIGIKRLFLADQLLEIGVIAHKPK